MLLFYYLLLLLFNLFLTRNSLEIKTSFFEEDLVKIAQHYKVTKMMMLKTDKGQNTKSS